MRDVNGARNNLLAPATALLSYAPFYDGAPDSVASAPVDEDTQEDGAAVDAIPDMLHCQ